MTRQEKQARRLILKEIMQTHNVTEPKARSILKELEQFGLISFNQVGLCLKEVGA